MIVARDLILGRVPELLEPLKPHLGRKVNPALLTPAEFKRRRTQPDSFVKRVLSQTTLPLIGDVPEPSRYR